MQQTYLSPPELGDLDDLHSTFIQTVSHELRTPLSIIQGYAELLGDGSLGTLAPDQQEAVFVIVDRADALRTMVERIDILLATEARESTSRPLALDKIVTDLVREKRPAVTHAGLALEIELEPGLPPVSGDPYHLQQAIDCLLENALKFTPDGGRVEVQVYTEPGWVCLAVTDTGIGMTEEELDHLFTHFYQKDRSTTRQYGGIGLGLTLVRAVIEEHGGLIEVESQPSQGSRFTIKLPAPSPAAQGAQPAEDVMASRRILTVDDEKNAALTLQDGLEKLPNLEIAVVAGGKQALQLSRLSTH